MTAIFLIKICHLRGLKIKEQEEERKKIRIQECGEDDGETESAECEIEYEAVKNLLIVGRRMIEV